MKTSPLALAAFLLEASVGPYSEAFAPSSMSRSSSSFSSFAGTNALVGTAVRSSSCRNRSELSAAAGAGFLGMDDDDEDDDEDDEDEDDDDDEDETGLSAGSRFSSSSAKSPFTGMKLDPWDPNPLIKPRPSRLFKTDDPAAAVLKSSQPVVPDSELSQTMTSEERGENLQVMRQIRKSDLPDLRRRKDHAGWVEANNDLKRRYAKDPWFGVNERLRDAIQLGQPDDKVKHLRDLAAKLGGPPPGIEIGSKGYAVHTEIYDIGISPSRASAIMEREIRAERAARGRAMMAERRKNQEKELRQFEEDMRNPGVREDREARERRERTYRRLMQEIEEDNKKKRERAKDILGKVPDTPESRTASMEKALQEAREEVKRMKRKQLGKSGEDDDEDGDGAAGGSGSPKTGAQKAREQAAAEAAGGRPRLPGDKDVTQGEVVLEDEDAATSSTTVTGPLQVEVTSVYNKEQSDPPMRKHCFQYTIRITNLSSDKTLQLLGRRFEIQTVGSSMKDVVQGEGVTGRTPVLAPGEVFEYTSTAPLSVRPIGTTVIAARMRGEYRYVELASGQETATEAQVQASADGKQTGKDDAGTAELGVFHFVFPQDQRVKPFRSAEEADDDDEDDDDDDDDEVEERAAKAKSAAAASPSSSSSSSAKSPAAAGSLPGDADMKTGDISVRMNDSSEEVTDGVRVAVTSSYRPERSDAAADKHCFAYNIRITNEGTAAIQLVSRRFEIQTVGSANKDVVQGPGVTGRQPILKPGESFEYTSTAPLSVKPMLEKTPIVARMQGEYNFVVMGADGTTPVSKTPKQAALAVFHFILPQMA